MDQRQPDLEFDELDIRMVTELEADARQSAHSLAVKLNSSPTTIKRRLQRLLDAQVIKVITVTDPAPLGLRIRAVIGISTRPGKQDSAAESLLSLRNTQYMWLTTGRYDIMIYTVFRDTHDLVTFVDQKLSRIPGLARIDEMMILEILKDSWMYLNDKAGAVGKAIHREVDESELQLIKELELCPRETITNLSSKMGMSAKAVRRKLQRLMDDNIIKIRSVVNPAAFGFGIQAAIFVKVTNGEIISAVNSLAENKKILHLLVIAGQFKILLHGKFRDMEELTHFLKNDLASIAGVVSQETLIMTRTNAVFGLLARRE